MLKALEYMHSDIPRLEVETCSVLRYARTAHFLDMKQLGDNAVSCATAVLYRMAADEVEPVTACEPSTHDNPEQMKCGHSHQPSDNTMSNEVRMSPWDAIAVLTLLGDPQQALRLVNLKQWYKR